MEILDTVTVILVQKMKGIVIPMMIARIVLYVDQTTVHLVLGSVLKLTVVHREVGRILRLV